jgi:hypothetical protein
MYFSSKIHRHGLSKGALFFFIGRNSMPDQGVTSDFNNLLMHACEDRMRYRDAIREVEALGNEKKLPMGHIVETHGLIFEWSHTGWILRPYDYHEQRGVYERFPRRMRFRD